MPFEPLDDDRREVGEDEEADEQHGPERGKDDHAVPVDPEVKRDSAAAGRSRSSWASKSITNRRDGVFRIGLEFGLGARNLL